MAGPPTTNTTRARVRASRFEGLLDRRGPRDREGVLLHDVGGVHGAREPLHGRSLPGDAAPS